jgi:class 3 adenylate cyclase
MAGFPGTCRVYRAEIMRLRGKLTDAQDEVLSAIDELRTADLTVAAAGLYELGEIRLRIGDMQGAEEAFREAHELGFEPQPGLALLHLSQGKALAAASMLNQALRDESLDRLQRARMLPAQVEANLACGDIERARAAAAELESIAESYRTPALQAATQCASGSVALAEGHAREAIQRMRKAQRLWQEVDAPYEAARCRMVLGAALEADGCEDDAQLEYRAARSTFEKLGTVPDALKAADAARALDGKRKHDAGAPGPRVTKTFMFTDIVSSTNLLEAIGDNAWEDLLRWHDQTLRGLLASHAGEEVKHGGDGFFVAFPDATRAAECAVAIQRALAEHRRAHGFAPQVRIGLHSAEATQRGADYFGKGIHETARIASLGGGGEILASAETVDGLDGGITVSEPRPSPKGYRSRCRSSR